MRLQRSSSTRRPWDSFCAPTQPPTALPRLGLARALKRGHPEAYLAKSQAVLEGLIYKKDPVLAYAYARVAEQEAAKNHLILKNLDRWKQQAARYLDQEQIAESEQLALELKDP